MLADASFHEEVANKINQVRSSSEKLPDVEELVEKLIRKLVFCLFVFQIVAATSTSYIRDFHTSEIIA